MKTTIRVEAAKTRSYQKYTVEFVYDFEYTEWDEVLAETRKAQTACRKLCIEQINLDLLK